jgi:hypothetical protein
MIKKLVLLNIVSVLLLTVAGSASAQMLFRNKKMYGPVPGMSININIGFIDGPDASHLFEHLDYWAEQQNGFESFNKISTSPYIQAGYEYRIAPQFFLTTKLNFSYLKTESRGNYVKNTTIDLLINRKLEIYLLSLDFGFKHYLSKPMPRTVCPYFGVGFSPVLPMVRLNNDSYLDLAATDEPYDNPEETVSKNSLVVGAHAEFGLNYFITNRFSAGIEARFQMCQSDFEIHNGNFDIKYAALNLALSFSHHF